MLNTPNTPVFAPETGSGQASEKVSGTAVVERLKQNGFTRPLSGTKTGWVWDIADEISAKEGRPALRDEVMEQYRAKFADASNGTISTQYSRWCGFHGVQDILRKMRAEEKAAKDAAKAEAKAEKEKLAAEKKAAAAEKKAAAEKAKAEKAAAKEAAAAAKAE